ncbi:f-box domain protein [Podospora conica]|nr:f-box domain protein [Schizothecium conicum]
MELYPLNDTMTFNILNLPEEIIFKIVTPLERRELCSLRLVCHRLHPIATQILFSVVRVYSDDDESLERYNQIIQHPVFKNHIRHVEFETLRDENDEEENEDPATLSPSFASALLSLPTLPSLASTTLRFSPKGTRTWEYPGERDSYKNEWPQTSTFRHSLLTTLFTALAASPSITSLHLDNLLNTIDPPTTTPPFLTSAPVRAVLSRLTSLNLSIVTEPDDACPEAELNDPRLHAFMAELPLTVFTPDCAANLRSLVLYQTTFHFGYAPKLDLRGVRFPRLRTLALGNYTFTHDWQLAWLGAHAGTLEELYLDDCVVVYYAKLLWAGFDGEGYPVFGAGGKEVAGAPREAYRFYDMTWAKILGYVRDEMVGEGRGLRKVMVGSSPRWDGGVERHCVMGAEEEEDGAQRRYPGREYEDVAVAMFRGRYVQFDMGIGPYQYSAGRRAGPGLKLEEMDGGDTEDGRKCLEFMVKTGQDEEDVAALRGLLGKLGQEVVEDWEDDVVQVKGLIGRRDRFIGCSA